MSVTELSKFAFEEIRKDKKYRYAIFVINSANEIDLQVVGHRDSDYETFVRDIQSSGPHECRYGVFDYEYCHQNEGAPDIAKKVRLLMLLWCPYTASAKSKMLYSSLLGLLNKSLDGIHIFIQATELSEASREAVEKKLRACEYN